MRVYIDTSVFGGCFDTEFEIWSNKLIELIIAGKYKAVISEVTEFELSNAPDEVRKILHKIPVKALEVCKITDEVNMLAEHYIKEKVVTRKSLADTQHIAAATINQVDVLVSWNFKHIVNFDKIRLYNAVT